MFDLRSALTSAITALNIQYITTKVFDGDSTEAALADIEKNVFTDGAVVVGDWVHESIAWTHGLNRVRNSIELLVCAKSATAQAALATTVNNLQVGLTRLSLNSPYWLTTIVADVSELRKTENARIQYKIMTLEVMAYESATAAETTTHLPSVTITSPAQDDVITVNGVDDFSIRVTYDVGDYPISAIHYIVSPTDPLRDGTYSLYLKTTSMAGGTDTATSEALPSAAVSTGTNRITVIIVDSFGASATDTLTITLQ